MWTWLTFAALVTPILTVDTQFTCAMGLDCKLALFDNELPATPSVRVGSVDCGQPSGLTDFQVIGDPVESFDVGVIPSVIGGLSTLKVCLKSTTASDPDFSILFGTVDIIGPTATVSVDCYMGSDCGASIVGNRLSSVYGVLFLLLSSGACATGEAPSTLFGLSATQPLLSSTATEFTFSSFGRVDPSLSQDESLKLCWSPTRIYSTAVPVDVGVLNLKGPLSRSI